MEEEKKKKSQVVQLLNFFFFLTEWCHISFVLKECKSSSFGK